MSQGRWKYKTEPVTVDGNTVEVRGLTYGERLAFAKASKDAREGKGDRNEIPGKLLRMGCVGLTDDDLAGMPGELIEAATNKILEMTGIDTKAGAGAGTDDAGDETGTPPGPSTEKKA